MEIYKGASAFAGIAIGKIRYYRRGDYQVRQHQASDVKRELRNFDMARRHVMQILKEEYDQNKLEKVLEQAALLGSGSFLRAVESMITGEKVTAAYAVMTTRDELQSTFSSLCDPSVKERIYNVARISRPSSGDSGRRGKQDRPGRGAGNLGSRQSVSCRIGGNG